MKNRKIALAKARGRLSSYRLIGRNFVVALLGGLLALPLLAAGPLDRNVTVNIAPGTPLDLAVAQLGQQITSQTGVQVMLASTTLGQQKTAGLSGTLPASAALQRLLKASGLTYHVNDDIVTIAPVAQGKPADMKSLHTAALSPTLGWADDQVANSPSNQQSVAPASDKHNGDELEEVTVTALKRAESLSKTAVAVTAVSQAQLTASGVNDLTTLTALVPNVEIANDGVFGIVDVSIRGIANRDPGEGSSPDVATYVDGVYLSRHEGLQAALFDLERIEVLRGPQGTLYGRNSTGGNINIITAQPSGKFAAAADVSAGNYGDVMVHGMVNLPVTDTLALRAAFMQHRSDGFWDTHGETARNYGASDDRGGRLTALWTPLDNFKWRLSFEDIIMHGTPGLVSDTRPDGTPVDPGSVYEQPVSSTPDPFLHVRNESLRSRIDWRLNDSFSIAYVAGMQTMDFRMGTSVSDGSTILLGSFPALNNHNYSHELNLNYERGPFTNIFGANYFHEATYEYSYFYLYNASLAINFPDPNNTVNSWGIFDQATYTVLDGLKLTAGFRYSSDGQQKLAKQEYLCPITQTYSSSTVTYPSGCTALSVGARGAWSSPTWKAGLDYDFTKDTFGYIAVTTGFKAGGLNDTTVHTEANYNPEHITNYEVGVKTHLLDRRLDLNFDIYYENYTGAQVTQDVPPNADTVTVNAAAAAIYGAEVEGAWLITPKDRLTAFLSYNHATYTDYKNAVDGLTGVIYPSVSGHFLAAAPEYSGRLSYAHDFSLSNGGVIAPSITVYAQSVSYLREFNLPIDRVPGYSKSDARLTYTDPSGHWKAEGYANNLENKAVRNDVFTFVGHYYTSYGIPRTYGLRLSYEY